MKRKAQGLFLAAFSGQEPKGDAPDDAVSSKTC
jgi:hypothetical protein